MDEPAGGEVGVPFRRRIVSRGAGLLLRLTRPVPGVRDYSCGYGSYRVSVLRSALAAYGSDGLVTTAGFAWMVEILLRLAAIGCRFTEIPLILRYDRKKGSSKMRVAMTILRYIFVLRAVPRRAVVEGVWHP